jgi:hypothetical protein
VQNAPTIGDVPSRIRALRPGAPISARNVGRAAWIRIGILVAFCAFYVWIAGSSDTIRFTSGADGTHGRIADALLHGRLYLDEAPAGLTALSNPFDPDQNQPYRFPAGEPQNHDLSLYHGKLYAYWGPVPALLLFAPARLLGFAFSDTLSVALFGFLALVFGVLALLVLQRRFAPRAPAWKVNVAIVGLGLANVLPYLIRRPAQYEVAISAGACFALLATWLVLGAVLRDDAARRPDRRRLALASLAMGLAVGSRPSHAITAAGLVVLAGWMLRGVARPERGRVAVALLGPLVACGALLALYNVARFGSLTEFGLSYQLASVDVTARDAFSLSYLPPGLWYYLVAPPRLSIVFPFVRLAPPPFYPGHVPADYDGVEPTGGLLVLAPILLVLLVAPFRRRLEGELRAVLLTFVGIAVGLVVIASIAFWGTTMRYEVDFASLLLLGALTVWLRSRARWATIVGVAAIAWASVLGLALSFVGSDDLLRNSHPNLWQSLTRDFSPVSRLAAHAAYGGPAVAEVLGTTDIDRKDRNYGTFGDQGVSFGIGSQSIAFTVVMPSGGQTRLRMHVRRGPGAVPGTRVDLEIALPDGRAGQVPITRPDQKVDVPLPLDRGVQQVELTALTQATPKDGSILKVDDLSVGGFTKERTE